MTQKSTSSQGGAAKSEAQSREDRLKAALKSNMGRRKAQARVRKASGDNNKNEQGQ